MLDEITLNTRIIYTIEILFSIAFVSTGLALLIIGSQCVQGKGPPSNPTQCENIYISGILILFICGIVLAFGLLFYIAERCEAPVPTQRVNRRHSQNSTDTVIEVRPRKVSLPKSVKNPLSSRNEKA